MKNGWIGEVKDEGKKEMWGKERKKSKILNVMLSE